MDIIRFILVVKKLVNFFLLCNFYCTDGLAGGPECQSRSAQCDHGGWLSAAGAASAESGC